MFTTRDALFLDIPHWFDVLIQHFLIVRVSIDNLSKVQKCIKKPPSFDEGFFEFGAGNETRTRDPNLGKVTEIYAIK